MPHLEGALRLKAAPGQKLCIHCAAGYVLDTPGATLCFGTFRASTDEEVASIGPHASREPFIHAWAEYRGNVYSPTLIEDNGWLAPINREHYYQANGATDVKYLTRPQLLAVARRIGLSRHLRLGIAAKASVGGSLLDAAGKRWQLGENGAGLIPR